MPIENKGFEYALTAFKNVGVDARLIGQDTSLPPGATYVTPKVTIDWNNPANVGGWQLVSNASNPITWEIEPDSGETITITSVEISGDDGGTDRVLLTKDFDTPYTFTARSVFNLEQITISAGIDGTIIPD